MRCSLLGGTPSQMIGCIIATGNAIMDFVIESMPYDFLKMFWREHSTNSMSIVPERIVRHIHGGESLSTLTSCNSLGDFLFSDSSFRNISNQASICSSFLHDSKDRFIGISNGLHSVGHGRFSLQSLPSSMMWQEKRDEKTMKEPYSKSLRLAWLITCGEGRSKILFIERAFFRTGPRKCCHSSIFSGSCFQEILSVRGENKRREEQLFGEARELGHIAIEESFGASPVIEHSFSD
jgi:hypothetical protein